MFGLDPASVARSTGEWIVGLWFLIWNGFLKGNPLLFLALIGALVLGVTLKRR